MTEAIVFAGIADKNPSLYRRLRVALGDPAAWFQIGNDRIALVRDIERERVASRALADRVICPMEYAPSDGLDADRETATAQALAVALASYGATQARVDRSFPMIYVHALMQAGLSVRYDAELGVRDRRVKTEEEIQCLANAQSVTESVMEELCGMIARSRAASDGVLHDNNFPLTSERVRVIAAESFLHRGFSMPHGAIVATTPVVADCHHAGEGPLRTEQPIVIDLFPRDEASRYWGDCTRTVVHGHPSDQVVKMHEAVCDAKRAAIAKLVVGQTAADVHRAATDRLLAHGFPLSRGATTDEASIQHGTGHGIGLEVHEPILLDDGGGELLEGEVFTVEPGLYGRRAGGVRVEDMLVVSAGTARNLNRLPEGLDWRT
ncbi:MAG: M24 family metallopeptidase [Planctomycetaceae bacterium]